MPLLNCPSFYRFATDCTTVDNDDLHSGYEDQFLSHCISPLSFFCSSTIVFQLPKSPCIERDWNQLLHRVLIQQRSPVLLESNKLVGGCFNMYENGKWLFVAPSATSSSHQSQRRRLNFLVPLFIYTVLLHHHKSVRIDIQRNTIWLKLLPMLWWSTGRLIFHGAARNDFLIENCKWNFHKVEANICNWLICRLLQFVFCHFIISGRVNMELKIHS